MKVGGYDNEEWFSTNATDDGRIVADVVRLENGHTEGLEPTVTEHFVNLIVPAKGSKTQKQLQ